MSQTPGGIDSVVHQMWDLAASLRAAQDALPEEISGSDATGAVTVVLGRAGDVTGIDVNSGWAAQLAPAALAAAVLEAAGVAASERMRTLAQTATVAAPPASSDPAPTRGAAPELAEGTVVPPLEDVAERVIGALHSVAASATIAPPVPAAVVGTGADGRVLVGLTAGSLTRCEIERSWLNGRPGQQLTMALNEALARARTAMRAEAAAAAERSAEMDRLLASALAHLRPPESAADGTPRQEDPHV